MPNYCWIIYWFETMCKKTPEEKELLAIELYSSGKTIAEVANIVGISVSTVARILDRYGIPFRGRIKVFKANGSKNGKAKLTEFNVLFIRHLIKSGVARKEVAKQFGVSAMAINRIVNNQTWKHVGNYDYTETQNDVLQKHPL